MQQAAQTDKDLRRILAKSLLIPPFVDLALPMLEICNDIDEIRYKELIDKLSSRFSLTQEERIEQLQSGQAVIANRVYWCVTHLKKAGLLEGKRGIVSITPAGKNALLQNLKKIDLKFLSTLQAYINWKASFGKKSGATKDLESHTPDAKMEEGYNEIKSQVAGELLDKLHKVSPYFFEHIVTEVFRAMGYGISHKVTPKSRDGGIDAVISEDKLGLDEIYLQAKRWSGTVPTEQVQKFVGAMDGRKSSKGIFVTTSKFSDGTRKYVKNAKANVKLVDGETLAGYMYDNGIGVTTKHDYAIKRTDESFFDDNN